MEQLSFKFFVLSGLGQCDLCHTPVVAIVSGIAWNGVFLYISQTLDNLD
jgi:hypothetical protein